ncbi:MAG: DNA primase, partial [Phycicoccus sp.]
VAGWLGVEVEQMVVEVRRAGRARPATSRPDDARVARGSEPRHPEGADDVPEPSAAELAAAVPAPNLHDPVVSAERQLLQAAIQYPRLLASAALDGLIPEAFTAPAHRAVFDGIQIAAAAGARDASTAAWVAAVADAAAAPVQPLVSELSVAPLPTRFDPATGTPPQRYLDSLVAGVHDAHLGRRIADATANVRRVQNDPAAAAGDLRERTLALHRLELERVRLREGVS